MNRTTLNHYRRFRSLGYRASNAYHAAHTLETFQALESEGKARITARPEFESYFDVYGEPDTKQEREAIIDEIERNGLWIVAAETVNVCACCGTENVETVDSVGMCIYSDPCDPFVNDYVIDLMQAAIEATNVSSQIA